MLNSAGVWRKCARGGDDATSIFPLDLPCSVKVVTALARAVVVQRHRRTWCKCLGFQRVILSHSCCCCGADPSDDASVESVDDVLLFSWWAALDVEVCVCRPWGKTLMDSEKIDVGSADCRVV